MINIPPDISYDKRSLPQGGWAFCFRHQTMGELGRVVVEDAPGGQCLLSCEIAGDPADPMTARRAALFQPLALQISNAMEAITGKSNAAVVPPLAGNR